MPAVFLPLRLIYGDLIPQCALDTLGGRALNAALEWSGQPVQLSPSPVATIAFLHKNPVQAIVVNTDLSE